MILTILKFNSGMNREPVQTIKARVGGAAEVAEFFCSTTRTKTFWTLWKLEMDNSGAPYHGLIHSCV